MGALKAITAVLGLKPVQEFLSALTSKLFKSGVKFNLDKKVVSAGGAAVWVMVLIQIAKFLDPALGEILVAYEGTLISFVVMVQLIVEHFAHKEKKEEA